MSTRSDEGAGPRGPAPSPNRGFVHLGDERLLSLFRLEVVKARFQAPDGTRFERDVVRDLGWVGVVPLLDERTAVLVRQYRPALDAYLTEIPAGLRDVPGEAPEETARRELAEEAGYAAGSLQQVAHLHNSAGFSDEDGYVFIARDLTAVPTDAQGIEEAHLEITTVDLDDVVALVLAGELTDVKTIIGLLMARELRTRP